MKRSSKSNVTNTTNNNNNEKGVKAMKRSSKSNVTNTTNNNNEKGVKAMKRSSKSNVTNTTNNNNNEKGVKAMKRSSKSNVTNTTNNNNNNENSHALQAAQILAALDPSILKAIGLSPVKAQENLEEKTSEASEPKSQKADRTYEIPSIGADFVKSGIYARPTSEAAAQYVAKSKTLCSDVLENLSAPITSDIEIIAERAEKNGGESLKDDLLKLSEKWEIPAQSIRVIMQLCAPVVGVCNPETDEIARRVYGMSRANALMGSACNTLMFAKAPDKEKALPFKRVGHNITALGLDFEERASVEECDFCDNDEDFEELVNLCDMWLSKCNPKNPPEKSAAARRSKSKDESSPVEDKSAAILAALKALLNK